MKIRKQAFNTNIIKIQSQKMMQNNICTLNFM